MLDIQHNVSKHVGWFDPFEFSHERVHLIGCGATGSALGMLFAKIGLSTSLQDFDEVESKNLANQIAFWHDSVGQSKVTALGMAMREHGLAPAAMINATFSATSPIWGTMVACCVDSIVTRKDSVYEAVRYSPAHWLVDIRITAHQIVVLGVNLDDVRTRKRYEATLTLKPEDVVEVRGVCGNVIGLADVAVTAAAIAERLTLQHLLRQVGKLKTHPVFQVSFDMRTFESSASF
jgi:hypothetical protein